MTATQIDILHLTHTCPANPEPHIYGTYRVVVAIAPGGPCRNPVTVRSGDTTAVIDCRRHLPREQRCPTCQDIVLEHRVTITFTGHHGPQDLLAGTAA